MPSLTLHMLHEILLNWSMWYMTSGDTSTRHRKPKFWINANLRHELSKARFCLLSVIYFCFSHWILSHWGYKITWDFSLKFRTIFIVYPVLFCFTEIIDILFAEMIILEVIQWGFVFSQLVTDIWQKIDKILYSQWLLVLAAAFEIPLSKEPAVTRNVPNFVLGKECMSHWK